MANRTKKANTDPDPQKLTVEKEDTFDFRQVMADERTAKVAGVFILMLAFFLLVSFASYVFTWKEDQDKVITYGIGILAPNDFPIANQLGTFGAYFSHLFIYKGFGLASFFFCAFLSVVGMNWVFQVRIFSISRHFRYLLAGLIIFSLTFSYFLAEQSFPYGGQVGDLLANWCNGLLGILGTGVLIFVLFFTYLIWRFNLRFSSDWLQRKSPAPVIDEGVVADGVHAEDEEEETKEVEDPEFVPIRRKPLQLPNQEKTKPEQEMLPITLVEKDEAGVPETLEIRDLLDPAGLGASASSAEVGNTSSAQNELELEIRPAQSPIPQKSTEDARKKTDLPPYDPILDLRDYKYPKLDLLEHHGNEKIVMNAKELEENKDQIISTLGNYDIGIQKILATVGPTVTLYEIIPAAGVRISRIKNLEDDIALSLSALGIRIIAPIPGKGTIGIEVPNVKKSIVGMKTILASEKFKNTHHALPIALGKTIDNEFYIVDLATMPHLLMAGATGQGKSVGINAILVSLLYKKHPSQLKLVLVDPKKVELSLYRHIEKHFLAKLPGEDESIITDTKKALYTLNALCIEMDNRYELLKDAGVRNIREYNEKFVKRSLNPQKGHQYMPFIVLVIDEFADLIMTAGKEIEMPIARLAQLARAVGIHLIIATQRPSVNIITGTIKANFPARIAFKVSSKVDSRTILDTGGAEQLIGKGDMLISNNGEVTRLQCAFVDTPEVDRVVDYIGDQRGYPDAFLLPEYDDGSEGESRDMNFDDWDPLFKEAARMVVQNQVGSTSLIQRRMKLGYNRAGRLMDQLEKAGIVGSNQGSKAREVLVKSDTELQGIIDRLGL